MIKIKHIQKIEDGIITSDDYVIEQKTFSVGFCLQLFADKKDLISLKKQIDKILK